MADRRHNGKITDVQPILLRRLSGRLRDLAEMVREATPMFHAESFILNTRDRGTREITAEVGRIVKASGIKRGLCTVFLHHTSASLILCENADPSVRSDLERYFARLVPDGDPIFRHTAEGPDDMPAHIRTILTQNSLTIPVERGVCDLGTWQGLYLWEHRTASHRRRVTVSIIGEGETGKE
jgi:secondary thiamine-phosphate synthase enzyme